MEDLIAVEVLLPNGGRRYYVTWGRVQDPVAEEPVCELVLRCAAHLDPASARVCTTLREAAESAPYFHEALFDFAQRGPIPRGDAYEDWRSERAAAMELGREIYDCGAA